MAEEQFLDILSSHNQQISPEKLKTELDTLRGIQKAPAKKEAKKQVIPSFIQFLDIYLEERQQAATFKLGSWKVLQTWATHLKAFSSAQRRPLQYEDINTQFLIPFKNWLCDPQRNLSDNYIVKGVKVLKQFMQYINVNQKSNATQFAEMVKGMVEG